MNSTHLSEIRARVEKAMANVKAGFDITDDCVMPGSCHEIFASLEDVPALLSEIERLRTIINGVIGGFRAEGMENSAKTVEKFLLE